MRRVAEGSGRITGKTGCVEVLREILLFAALVDAEIRPGPEVQSEVRAIAALQRSRKILAIGHGERVAGLKRINAGDFPAAESLAHEIVLPFEFRRGVDEVRDRNKRDIEVRLTVVEPDIEWVRQVAASGRARVGRESVFGAGLGEAFLRLQVMAETLLQAYLQRVVTCRPEAAVFDDAGEGGVRGAGAVARVHQRAVEDIGLRVIDAGIEVDGQ